MQAPSSPAARTSDSARSRAGSATALSRVASRSASFAVSGAADSGAQHAVRVLLVMRAIVLTTVDGFNILMYVDTLPRHQGATMSRVQLALNVDDLDAAVAFYT